jgi:hypothetical protein
MGPVYIPCGSGGQPTNDLPVQNGEISPTMSPPRGVPVRDNPPVIPCIGSNGLVQYAPNPVGGGMLVENGGVGGSGCGGCTGGTISVQQGLAASRAVTLTAKGLALAAVALAVVASLVVIH